MLAAVVVAHPSPTTAIAGICRCPRGRRAWSGRRPRRRGARPVPSTASSVAMSAAERIAYHGDSPILRSARRALRRRRPAGPMLLVFVYPTWWSGLPAILKGWLERVMVPGVGVPLRRATGKVKPGLGHVRTIVGISTYGSPRAYVRLVNDNGRRILTRALRMSCGMAHADDVARAVRDRHVHRCRRADSPHWSSERGRWRTCDDARALVVYCHPDDASFVRAIRDRVVATLDGGRAPRCGSTDLYADGFDPTFTATNDRAPRARRSPRRCSDTPTICMVRHARARLPDVVVRPAGDAQGLDRPGLGQRRGVGAPTGRRPARGPCSRNVRRLVAVTTHGSSKLVNAIEGESRQAHAHPQPPGDVPPARPDAPGSRCTASTRRPR